MAIRMHRTTLFALTVFIWAGSGLRADDLLDRLTKATQRIAESAHTYTKERDCFSCHHQSLPVYALSMAAKVGVDVDESVYKVQDDHTDRFFWDRRSDLEMGKGVPGARSPQATLLLSLLFHRKRIPRASNRYLPIWISRSLMTTGPFGRCAVLPWREATSLRLP